MPSQKKTTMILIADDHPGWIEGVRSIIHKASDMQIVGKAHGGNQIKEKFAELQPDVLLLNLVMPLHNPILAASGNASELLKPIDKALNSVTFAVVRFLKRASIKIESGKTEDLPNPIAYEAVLPAIA